MMVVTPELLSSVIGLFTGAGEDPSIASRTGSFCACLRVPRTQPVVRSGLGTFLPKYRIFDNQYLLLLVTIGVVGTLAFLRSASRRSYAPARLRSAPAGRRLPRPRARPGRSGVRRLLVPVHVRCLRLPDDDGDAVPRVGRRGCASSPGGGALREREDRHDVTPGRRLGGGDLQQPEPCRCSCSTASPAPWATCPTPSPSWTTVPPTGRWTCSTSVPTVQVVRSTNDGYAAGMNRGVRASPGGRAVLVLNPDAVLDRGLGARSDVGVLRSPGWAIVAPRVREEDGTPVADPAPGTDDGPGRRPELHRPASVHRTHRGCRRSTSTEHEVEWAVGAILLIDAGLLRRARRYGRVVLPLLRRDGLQPAGQGRRMGHRLHADRRERCTSVAARARARRRTP